MKNLKFQILTCAAVISLEVQASRMLRLGEDSDDFGAELNALEYFGDSGEVDNSLSLSTMSGFRSSGNVSKDLKLLDSHKTSSSTYNLLSQLKLKPASKSAKRRYGKDCSLTITNQTIGKSPSFGGGQNPFYFLQGPANSFQKTRIVIGFNDTFIRLHFIWKTKLKFETGGDEVLSVLEIPFAKLMDVNKEKTVSFQELFTSKDIQIYSNPLIIRRWLESFDSHISVDHKISHLGIFGFDFRQYEDGFILDRSTHTTQLPKLRRIEYWCDIPPTSLKTINLSKIVPTESLPHLQAGLAEPAEAGPAGSEALTPVQASLSAAGRPASAELSDTLVPLDVSTALSSSAALIQGSSLISPAGITEEQPLLMHLNQIDLTSKNQVELTLDHLEAFIIRAENVEPTPRRSSYQRLEDLKIWQQFLSRIEYRDDGMIKVNFTEIKNQKLRHLFIHQLRKTSFANKLFGLRLENTNINAQECTILINKLSKLDSFRKLSLENNSIGIAGVKALAPHLGKLTQLQSLDLGGIWIGDAGAKALAPHLGKLTQLQFLNLGQAHAITVFKPWG